MCKFDRFSPVADVMAVVATVDKPFARKIVDQYRNGQGVTARQYEVAVQIANEAKPAKRNLPEPTGAKVFETLTKADVRRARIVVAGETVLLKSNKARTGYTVLQDHHHLGTITDRETFRVGMAYMGRPSTSIDIDVLMQAMRDFAADPLATLATFGLKTGTCGICGRRLEDAESVARGIGPVCLKRLTA